MPQELRHRNRDGTVNLYCQQCGNFISKSQTRYGFLVTCAVCSAVENGEILPAETIRQMRNPSKDIPFNNMEYDPMFDGVKSNEEITALQLSEQPAFWFRALTTLGKKLQEFTKPNAEASKALAKEKRPPRIFQLPSEEKKND